MQIAVLILFATRELLLRSALDARFILYHHVIRRRVQTELRGKFADPLAAHIDQCWDNKLSSGALFVNDQFVTLLRRPAHPGRLQTRRWVSAVARWAAAQRSTTVPSLAAGCTKPPSQRSSGSSGFYRPAG